MCLGGQSFVLIAVPGSGIGLRAENLPRLFAPLHNESGRHRHGVGYQALNRGSGDGRLWATPNADFGATFQFMLPVQT
jgi:hypothetical protein